MQNIFKFCVVRISFLLCLNLVISSMTWAQETEPNNNPSQANVFALNTSLNAEIGVLNDEDWFKITTPEEGVLKVVSSGITLNDFYITLYDVNGTTLFVSANVYPLGDVDSVFKTNIQAGTYYLRVYPFGSNTGGYTITNSFTAALLPNDAEPNNTFENAQVFPLNSQTTGRLNYVLQGVFDSEDWFKITTPEEGTLKIISHSPDNNDYYIRLVDVNGITTFATSNVYPLGELDSVYKTNLQAGTYYVRVFPFGANHGSYHLRNIFTPALLPNDPEPNNTVEEAKEFPIDTQITGRLNYVYAGAFDQNDWYYIDIPDDGTLKVISESPDMNDYYIRLVDVNGSRILHTANVYPLTDIDSVYRHNLQAGRYFVQVYPFGSNHGSYILKSSFTPALYASDPEPNNSFENAVPISADTVLTGRLNYVYDNVYDNQDWFAVTMPQNGGLKVTTNSPDNYDYYLRIIGSNGTSVISSVNVYQYATKSVYAWNLIAGNTYFIKLDPFSTNFGSYNLAVEFQPAPQPAFKFSQQFMKVLFNNESNYGVSYQWNFGDGTTSTQVNPSHTYSGPGAYEVRLTATNPNGSNDFIDFVQFRGIQKVEGTHGGNSRIVTVTVFAGGLGSGSVPKLRNGAVEIVGTNIVFPKTGQVQAEFDLSDAALGLWDVVVQNPGETEMVLAQAYTVEEATEPDVFVEISGRDRALFNRWSTYNIYFGNRGNTDAFYQILWIAVPDSVEFKNIIFDASLYNDPEVEAYLQGAPPYWEIDTLGTEPFNGRLYGIPFQKIPAGYSFNIELRIKAEQNFQIVAFSTAPWFDPDDFPKTMSYNECVAWAMATMIRDKLIEQLTGLVPGADCIYGGVKTLSELTLAYSEDKLTVTSLGWGVSQVVWTCLKNLGENIPFVKAMKISKVMIDLTVDIVNGYNSDVECQKYKIKAVIVKNVTAANSLDPNEIAGPAGFGEAHHIAEKNMNYTVYFENQNTATANAVEVFIYDTLNMNYFEMSSFKFGNIWIGGTTYEVVNDGNGFALDVDIRPEINSIVRVTGQFNPENGVAYWHFMSLDPVTMDITEDPEGGFLPPNINKPEGEGFVSYVVDLKTPFENQDLIEAKATIVFDFNEPIHTNTYRNRIDLAAPQSSVYQIQPFNSDLYEVFWQGTDEGSGVSYFNIYMAEGNGPFTLWKNHTSKLSDTIRANPETYYRFFAQAVDKLGNEEAYKDYAEQILGLDDVSNPQMAVRFVPNPAEKEVTVHFVLDASSKVDLILYSLLGQKVFAVPESVHSSGENDIKLDISHLQKGVYTVVLQTVKGQSTAKLIVR
ncbi:MAG: T9SS type A sorting domain-containing protein [Bacteroidales bacterium]|nr:T9SS type A sorting domain-containing protein [Bacteroidales bacterium]